MPYQRNLGIELKISDILFPDSKIADAEKLYFHTDNKCICSDNNIIMKRGAVLSLDTYFNSMPVSQYLEYTDIKDISVYVKTRGHFRAETVLLSQEGEQILKSTEIFSDGESEIFNDTVNTEKSAAILFARLTALDDNCIFEGGFYKTSASGGNIRIAIAVCTYKREEYIIRNALNFSRIFGNSDSVSYFIADNACTLEKNDLPENDNIHLFHNRNLGGSGGFSRGIYEILESGEDYTHIILTDDDINIDWRVLEKLSSFLSLLKPEFSELCAGGGMFDRDCQCVQYEAGALCRNRSLEGIEMNLDMSDRNNILRAMSAEKPDYCGWWCCCMPVSMVRKNGFPLPLFIKFDDVEYALRGKMNFIMPVGICVWHENFEKKYQPLLEYYITRNSLITYSLENDNLPLKTIIRNFMSTISGLVFMQRYKTADIIIKAYEDYLKGAEFLENNDEEKYHRLLGSGMPREISLDEIYKKEKNIVCGNAEQYHISRFKKYLTLNGMFVSKKEVPLLNIRQYCTELCYGYKKTIQYNPKSNTGYITERSFFKTLALLMRTIAVSAEIAFKYNKAEQSYKNNLKTLTSAEMWKKRFEKNGGAVC